MLTVNLPYLIINLKLRQTKRIYTCKVSSNLPTPNKIFNEIVIF